MRKAFNYNQGNNIKANVKYLSFFEGVLDLEVAFDKEMISTNEEENTLISLVIKRRKHEHTFEHLEVKKIKPNNGEDSIFSVDVNFLARNKLESVEYIWDFFVEIIDREGILTEILLLSEGSKGNFKFKYQNLKKNNLYRVKPYVTGDFQSLALLIRQKVISANVNKLEIDQHNIELEGSLNSSEYNIWDILEDPVFVVVRKREMVTGNFKDVFTKKIKLLNTYITVNLDLAKILQSVVFQGNEIWDLYIRIMSLERKVIDIPFYIREIPYENYDFKKIDKNSKYQYKLFRDENDKMGILIQELN